MQPLVSFMVKNAQIHPLGMQIHATIEWVLPVVESHHGPPRAERFNGHAGTQRKASGVQGAAMSPLLADTKSAKASQDVSVLG
jgi:hypothetical protein